MSEPRTLTQIAGAMTHMCISATARRWWPMPARLTPCGGAVCGSISAARVHDTALAAIADGFNVVMKNASAWQ